MDYDSGYKQKRYANEKRLPEKKEADKEDWDSKVPSLIKAELAISWLAFLAAIFIPAGLAAYVILGAQVLLVSGAIYMLIVRFERLDIVHYLIMIMALVLASGIGKIILHNAGIAYYDVAFSLMLVGSALLHYFIARNTEPPAPTLKL